MTCTFASTPILHDPARQDELCKVARTGSCNLRCVATPANPAEQQRTVCNMNFRLIHDPGCRLGQDLHYPLDDSLVVRRLQ